MGLMMERKILIVDDEPDLLKVVSFRLEKAGYKVLCAITGKEALEMAARERPDLILLDLRLPLLNGLEVCVQLKKSEELKQIPVIIFTASTSHIDEKTKACGADDYIIKPFTPEELSGKIKKLIG